MLSIFLDMGDNITEDINSDSKLMCVNAKSEKDLKKNELVKEV